MPELNTIALMLLTASAGGALALATVQKRRASMMGAAAALMISALTTVVVAFDIQPFALHWLEAGWAGFPPFLIAVYGVGSAMAWRYSRSEGSLRAAIACLIASPAVSYLMFANTMGQMREIIARASPQDQASIWQGSFGEAVRIMEIGGLVSVLTAVILMVSLGAPRTPAVIGEAMGSRTIA